MLALFVLAEGELRFFRLTQTGTGTIISYPWTSARSSDVLSAWLKALPKELDLNRL
jgi:hypothetical protein